MSANLRHCNACRGNTDHVTLDANSKTKKLKSEEQKFFYIAGLNLRIAIKRNHNSIYNSINLYLTGDIMRWYDVIKSNNTTMRRERRVNNV